MFEEIKQKLESIDSVLNEETLNYWNERDAQKGFDLSKTYTKEELKRFLEIIYGIELLKKSNEESKYILLEVSAQKNNERCSRFFLRGFEMFKPGHPALASGFLGEDLEKHLSPPFKFPYLWPSTGNSISTNYLKMFKVEANDVKLTVSVLGGGKYEFKEQNINLWGSSDAFGAIPIEYHDKTKELLDQLIQKPTYQGFKINCSF
jgi:hypothetical protein